MKKVVWIFLFIVLMPSLSAVWEQFQFDEFNSGRTNGTGYFNSRNLIDISNSLDGYEKQPIVGDIDNNGKNEIVIFSGNYLKIFDNKLNLISEKYVGKLQGQPAIFDIYNNFLKEIIFISNIFGVDYFFVYEYNKTNFNQKFNFTVANGGIGSGIKCTALDSAKICVFMDNAQYVHIVNLSSKTDNSYNTSVYKGNTIEKIPAIGDLHNNGGLEAVFWFDENNNNQYGLIVFNLINKSLDSTFNSKGIVDDIVKSIVGRFVLKGHPVLVDLNNDGKLEIAISAYYDDDCVYWYCNDWFTELFVYSDRGSQLIAICNLCNEGDSHVNRWDGSNPFVMDFNTDDTDDICFINHNTVPSAVLNCYDYSGGEIAESEMSGIKVITADMDNDGAMDIITENNIYHKNGSSFFGHNFGSNFAIPVDIDGNHGLDLLLSKSFQTKLFIDNFGTVEVNNVSISPLVPSSDDSLSCSWIAEGNGALKANISWYKDDALQSTETNIGCNNGSICIVSNHIPSASTAKNDVWKCSVTAFNENFHSYAVSDTVAILGKTSEWADYCNAKNNFCRQSGASYFSNAGAVSINNNSEGMRFEPLVADINNNGKNEIVIFSNSNLIVYNDSLGLINKVNVGNLIGQPSIYNMDSDNNLEIIFNVGISSTSYFMAYKYSNGFSQQCNLTISNGASGSGIKCADIGTTKSCFFKDQKNVFYNINMSNSCAQTANLTANNQEDATPTVPSILDYDKDGKLEGMWWFNNDSDAFMGIAIIELETMSFDAGFNNIGFIDDVTQGGGTRYVPGFENLKGNPVFYPQDNGGGYEILVSYDNELYVVPTCGNICYKSNIKVFDTDGNPLWTRTPETPCPICSTGTFKYDMSTPVIVDVDNDNYEDICFIFVYANGPNGHFYCLDRFGNYVEGYAKNTADVIQYGSYSTNIDTNMYLADMDNDGKEEMIGAGYIWNLNGTILKGSYSSFTAFAPVPVDVNKDGILELLGTKTGETLIFSPNVDICSGRVQVISVDSNDNPIGNANFFINNVLEGTTDDFGLFENQQNSLCGDTLSYTLKCENNSAICETKTTTLDIKGDFKGLTFDCSVCGQQVDLRISTGNINANKKDSEVKINVTLINVPTASNLNITFKVQGNDGLISGEESQLFGINSSDRFKFITQSIALAGDDFVHVYVDPDNKVAETNEKNNYAVVPLFEKEIDAYLNISTGYSLIDNEIKDYLKLFVNEKPQNEADVTIALGLPNKNAIINNKNSLTKTNYKWRFDDRIYYNNKPLGSKPYNGLVGAFSDDYNYIFVAGNDIDGLIAAVKRLISARELFFNNFNKDKVSVIEDTDVSGISVADLLRSPSNWPYYQKRGSIMFVNVVDKILNNNNFEISIKTVKSYNDNTTLRLKNINTDFSNDFKEVVVGNAKPVVLARGLWSNLLSWQEFGKELAFDKENARDTWLMEITGGPEQDCSTCPNYEYEDLTDYYWPALITGVQNYSGKKTLDYVGFSNGCRTALDSLKNWSSTGKNNAGYVFDSVSGNYILADLSSNPISTFVGVGCPGAFDGDSVGKTIFNKYGQQSLNKLSSKNHIEFNDFVKVIFKVATNDPDVTEFKSKTYPDTAKISNNLIQNYLDISMSNTDSQPGKGLSIAKFSIIRGYVPLISPDSDMMVTKEDTDEIYNNINSSNKYQFKVYGIHGSPVLSSITAFPDRFDTKSIIRKILNNNSFLFTQLCFNLEKPESDIPTICR